MHLINFTLSFSSLTRRKRFCFSLVNITFAITILVFIYILHLIFLLLFPTYLQFHCKEYSSWLYFIHTFFETVVDHSPSVHNTCTKYILKSVRSWSCVSEGNFCAHGLHNSLYRTIFYPFIVSFSYPECPIDIIEFINRKNQLLQYTSWEIVWV